MSDTEAILGSAEANNERLNEQQWLQMTNSLNERVDQQRNKLHEQNAELARRELVIQDLSKKLEENSVQMKQMQEMQMQMIMLFNAHNASTCKFNSPVPIFSGKPDEDIDAWIFTVENGFETSKVMDLNKVSLAAAYLRDLAQTTFRRLKTENQQLTWDLLKRELQIQFQPLGLQKQLRSELDVVKQKNSFEDYLHQFYKIINKITGMSELDKMHYFTKGLASKTKSEVQYQDPKSLDEAIKIATRYERHFFGEKTKREECVQVSYVNGHNDKVKTQENRKQHVKCYNCGKQGHYQKECRQNQRNHQGSQQNNYHNNRSSQGSKPKHRYTQAEHQLIATLNSKSKHMTTTAHVNGVRVKAVLDSGAEASVMSEGLAQKFGFKRVPCKGTVKSALGEGPARGTTEMVDVIVHGVKTQVRMSLLPIPGCEVLLGMDWLEKARATVDFENKVLYFNGKQISLKEDKEIEIEQDDTISQACFVSDLRIDDDTDNEDDDDWKSTNNGPIQSDNANLDDEQKALVQKLIDNNKDLFAANYKDLGCCNIAKFSIKTTTDIPIARPPYRKSIKENQFIDKEIEMMLEANIIRPSTSEWSSPIHLVPKPGGDMRFCLDIRPLNEVTVTEQFPIPRMDDILDRMGKSRWFTILDLKSGYWQIALDEESIPKTAFSCNRGHFEWLRAPFGLKNLPKQFNRIMKLLFGHLESVENYYDDLPIHTITFYQHYDEVEKVFGILRNANLKINPKKCKWFQNSVTVLGHVIGSGNIAMDPDKVRAISEMKAPINIKQVQQFLGLCGYYRKFIKNFSHIANPLFSLLKKDTIWKWSSNCDEAFEMLKTELTSYPILRNVDFEKEFIIYTDASGVALGAILSQKDGENEYVCAYASRKLKPAEMHYGISEKECLAVLFGIKKFRVYVHGTKFTVVTDHSALCWLMKITDPTGRLARWSIYLQAYDFIIKHRKGRKHSNVDALSRPVFMISTSIEEIEDDDNSAKTLDPFEDDTLLYYLKHRKFRPGTAKKQCKRVEKLATHYQLKDDELWYRKNEEDEYKLRVPRKEKRAEIAKKAHLLGHFQSETTYDRLKDKYFWKKMKDDIKAVIEQCWTCARFEKARTVEHPAQALQINSIFERVGIDLVLGLPNTDEGYNGIVVITEYLTKYPYAAPITSKTAEETAKHLFDYITIFGPPKELLSDQGKEFLNSTMEHMLQLTGTEHKVTSSYHPRTNGLTERFNQTLVKALKKHSEVEPKNWHTWLSYILLAYRTRINTITGFTPFELMFGRQMLGFENWKEENDEETDAAIIKRAFEIKNMVENTNKQAVENIQKKQEIQIKKQNNQHNITSTSLQPGTQVFLKVQKMHGKLEPNYHGPYTVVEKTKRGNYKLKNAKGVELKQAQPLSRLKITNLEANDEQSFEIEDIRDHRMRRGQIEYLVKWKDFPEEDNTWEKEAQFDTTECIEEYWSKQNTTAINYVKVDKSNEQDSGTQSRLMNQPTFQQIMCFIIFTAMILIQKTKAIQVIDTFKYCETHQNHIVLDMQTACTMPEMNNKENIIEEWIVLAKRLHVVDGVSFMCKKQEIIYTTSKTWAGTPMTNKIESTIKLTRSDCEYMVATKRCNEQIMKCVGDVCSYNKEPALQFEYWHTKNTTVYSCEFLTRPIVAESADKILFDGAESECTARSLSCNVGDFVIFWKQEIIHDCPFSYIQHGQFTSEKNTAFIYSTFDNLLFQTAGNFVQCNITIWQTTQGLYLTQDVRAKSFYAENKDIRTIDDLILADNDFKANKLYKTIWNQNAITNVKLCYLFMNLLRLSHTEEDELFQVFDFQGNEMVLYNHQGTFYIPQCVKIEKINVTANTNQCFQHIPITFRYAARKINGFLTHDRLIRTTSKIVNCKAANLKVHLYNKSRILKKVGGKTSLVQAPKENSYKLFLTKFNVTELNFLHTHNIIEGVDVIKQFEALTHTSEQAGYYHTSPDAHTETKAELLGNIANLADQIGFMLDPFLHMASHIASYIGTIIVGIVIYKIIKHILKRRRIQTQITTWNSQRPQQLLSHPATTQAEMSQPNWFSRTNKQLRNDTQDNLQLQRSLIIQHFIRNMGRRDDDEIEGADL